MINKRDSGIYVIIFTHPETKKKKFYIGQAVNFESRWNKHKTDFNRNKCSNRHMKSIYDEFGISVFKFIPIEKTSNITEILNERENYWLHKFIDKLGDNVLNINRIIAQSSLGVKRTEETKQKLTEFQIRYSKTEQGKLRQKKATEASLPILRKPMPVMINLKTGHRIEACDGLRQMAKKIGCANVPLKKYIDGQRNHIKGYVSEEHYHSGKQIVEPKETPTPKFYNIKTLQIIEEQSTITNLSKICNVSTSSISLLLNNKKQIVKNWCIYNSEKHLTETDYQYE